MSKVKSFFARKYGNGAGRCEGSGFRNGSSASSVTTPGEMLIAKFFAKNGPSGWYSQRWVFRAAQHRPDVVCVMIGRVEIGVIANARRQFHGDTFLCMKDPRPKPGIVSENRRFG